jgi:hypothetical protein
MILTRRWPSVATHTGGAINPDDEVGNRVLLGWRTEGASRPCLEQDDQQHDQQDDCDGSSTDVHPSTPFRTSGCGIVTCLLSI